MKTGINAGSGQRPFRSTPEVQWVNLDCQERYRPDIVCDLKEPWQIGDETVDYVVFHHVLEHEGCGEATHYLRESRRVLKSGGSLLVFVPDMRALAQRWLMGKLETQVYMTNVYGAYHGDEHDRHRWGMDIHSLGAHLRDMFPQVWSFDWRIIPGADIARDWWILAMEAVK